MMKKALLFCLVATCATSAKNPAECEMQNAYLVLSEFQTSQEVIPSQSSYAEENLLIRKQYKLTGECNGTYSVELAHVPSIEDTTKGALPFCYMSRYVELEKKKNIELQKELEFTETRKQAVDREIIIMQREIKKLKEKIKVMENKNVDVLAQQRFNEKKEKLYETLTTCQNDLILINTFANADKRAMQEITAKLSEYEIAKKNMDTNLKLCQDERNATLLLAQQPIVKNENRPRDSLYYSATIGNLQTTLRLSSDKKTAMEFDKTRLENDLNRCKSCCIKLNPFC